MRKKLVQLAVLGLMVLCLGALGGSGARAGMPASLGEATSARAVGDARAGVEGLPEHRVLFRLPRGL